MSSYAPFPSKYLVLLAGGRGTVLLQTSRFDAGNHRSFLFAEPVRVLSAETLEQLPTVFDGIEGALNDGAFVAGFLGYECGEHFERIGTTPAKRSLVRAEPQGSFAQLRTGSSTSAATAASAQDDSVGETGSGAVPLAWFGVYPKAYVFDHRTGRFIGEAPDHLLTIRSAGETSANPDFEIRDLHLKISQQDYAAGIAAIHEYIRAGDVYQVNYTDKVSFEFLGSPVAMFQALSARQSVSYSAFLDIGGVRILSFSPELFFRIREGRITTRPMKGTCRRGRDRDEDARLASWLQTDSKNRSENVMIVDLLRNDLGRICQFGSVRAEELFAIEKYETLFQMSSTVSGLLRPGLSCRDIFASLFPCGSVTGAPKIRAMQIIRELERGPRSLYTGAIGFISPNGEAEFNVAIRTVVLNGGRGEMGVGSGVVIDSVAEDEYQECLLKSQFLSRDNRSTQPGQEPLETLERAQSFQLIESILWNGEYPLLPLHLERLEKSAANFGFEFDRSATVALLESNAEQLQQGTCYKVRLLLDSSGALTIENATISPGAGTGKVAVSGVRTCSADGSLYHKTTRRVLYNEMYARARENGFDDVLFLNERDEVTEGAISNVFVVIAGRWFTPPVACGLLPGVYRRHLLKTNPAASERVLSLSDLQAADAIYLSNAVRGLRRVVLEDVVMARDATQRPENLCL